MWRYCPFWIVNYLSINRLYAVTNIAGQEIINHNVPPSGPNRVKSKYNYHHDVGVLWNLSKVSSHNSFYISYIVPIVFFGLVRLYVLELGYIFVDLFCFFEVFLWKQFCSGIHCSFLNDHHCRKLLRQTTIWRLLSLLSVRLSPSQWKYPCQRPCCWVSWWWWWWLRLRMGGSPKNMEKN